jgi:hypothetical protein
MSNPAAHPMIHRKPFPTGSIPCPALVAEIALTAGTRLIAVLIAGIGLVAALTAGIGRIVALTAAIVLIVPLVIATPARAQTSESLSPDARARGMGEAYTSIAEGGSAAWWNPGALGLLEYTSLTLYSPMDYGLGDHGGEIIHRSFGISGRHRALGYGVHLNHMSLGKQTLTNEQGSPIGSYNPHNYTLLIGAGTDILPALHVRSRYFQLGLGGDLRLVHYNAPPPSLTLDRQDNAETGEDLDLGALAIARLPFDLAPSRPHHGSSYAALRLGAVRTSILSRKLRSKAGDDWDLERETRLGGAVDVGIADVPPIGHLLRVIYAVERHKDDVNVSGSYNVWGLEATLLNFFSVRGGHIEDPKHGYVVDTHGFGAGFHWKGLFGARLDYAKHRRGAFPDELDMITFSVSLDPDLLMSKGK